MNDDKPISIQVELIDYIDRQVRNLDEKWAIRHDALHAEYEKSEQAVDTASKVLDARLEGMNEFRAQLTRQAATFVCMTDVDQRIEVALANQRLVMAQELPALKVQITAIWAVLFGTLSIIGAAFIAHILGLI